MLAVRVAVLAAGGGLVAVPSVAHADNPPGSSETSGAVAGFPGYTWDVIVDGAGNATVTVIGPAAIPSAPVWASFDGGAWYYTNMYDPTGGSMWTLADPSQLPPFLNPDVDPTDYGSFIMQILPSLSPQPLPDFPPPPSDPPTLDTTDPGDDPGSFEGMDPGGWDPGDLFIDPGGGGDGSGGGYGTLNG